MGFKKVDRSQYNLLGISLEDLVEEKSKCKFILEIINQLDLSKLYKRYSRQGAESFDPSMILAVWFYGYCESVSSSRKLEERCIRDIHYIFLSGYLRPDHTTLSRFRKRHLDLIQDYFVQIICIAKAKGYSQFKEIAIDGSKIKAVSSKQHSKQSKYLEHDIQRIEKDIEGYLNESEENDKKENTEKINELIKRKELLEQRYNQLEARKPQILKKNRERHQINIMEPEAYLMNLGSDKGSAPGYNAQISVDMSTHLIAGSDLVVDRSDNALFKREHRIVEKNIGQDKNRIYVADTGYYSMKQLEYIYQENINGIIGLPNIREDEEEETQRRISKNDFVYNPEKDYYKCPAGKKLEYYKEIGSKNNKGKQYRIAGCGGCKKKLRCFPSNTKQYEVRNLTRSAKEEYAEKMKNRLREKETKEFMRKRSSTVETVFGNIKSNLGYNRFLLKGLEQAKGEFKLMCIAHNLNRLFKMSLHNFFRRNWSIFLRYINSETIKINFAVFGSKINIIEPYAVFN